MSLPVWLPGPMFLLGWGSASGEGVCSNQGVCLVGVVELCVWADPAPRIKNTGGTHNVFQSLIFLLDTSKFWTFVKIQCTLWNVGVFFSVVTRHQARLITLEYQGDGPVDQTLLLVGKVLLKHCLSIFAKHKFTLFRVSIRPREPWKMTVLLENLKNSWNSVIFNKILDVRTTSAWLCVWPSNL